MKHFRILFAALLSGPLLAACSFGASSSPSVGLGMLQQRQAQPAHRRGYTWMVAEAKSQDLLYVSNTLFNEVWVFSYPGGHPVGNLTGFPLPAGICVNQ